jgi:hypothetical protein
MHLADFVAGKAKSFTSKGKDALQINALFQEEHMLPDSMDRVGKSCRSTVYSLEKSKKQEDIMVS